jgi:hypothetical protein
MHKDQNLTPWRGFEPTIFCSDFTYDHCAAPPGQLVDKMKAFELYRTAINELQSFDLFHFKKQPITLQPRICLVWDLFLRIRFFPVMLTQIDQIKP